MKTVTLPNVPNSKTTFSVDDMMFTLTVRTFKGMTLFSVADENGEIYNCNRAITGQWIIPYKHLALNGNFRFESEHSEDYPYFTGFNDDFILKYYTSKEVEEIGW